MQQRQSCSYINEYSDRLVPQKMSPKTTTRSVRFSETTTCIENECSLSFEDVRDLWYGPEELFLVRQRIRALVHACRTHKYDLPRGMEVHGSDERVRRRWMTLQCIKSASRKGMDARSIAEISLQCTAWNAEIAVIQAIRDFAAVYPVPEAVQQALPSMLSHSVVPPTFPFAMERKRRSNSSCSAEEIRPSTTRRVRRRIASREETSVQEPTCSPLSLQQL